MEVVIDNCENIRPILHCKDIKKEKINDASDFDINRESVELAENNSIDDSDKQILPDVDSNTQPVKIESTENNSDNESDLILSRGTLKRETRKRRTSKKLNERKRKIKSLESQKKKKKKVEVSILPNENENENEIIIEESEVNENTNQYEINEDAEPKNNFQVIVPTEENLLDAEKTIRAFYSCKLCKKGFSSAFILCLHLKIHEKVGFIKPEEEESDVCKKDEETDDVDVQETDFKKETISNEDSQSTSEQYFADDDDVKHEPAPIINKNFVENLRKNLSLAMNRQIK